MKVDEYILKEDEISDLNVDFNELLDKAELILGYHVDDIDTIIELLLLVDTEEADRVVQDIIDVQDAILNNVDTTIDNGPFNNLKDDDEE